VSVIVPVYNVEDYLDECLDSVRGQTYERLEILLVDDGSTDASSALAARHASADPRIRVIRQDNAGLGAARNTGVRHATGEFLYFVDSDDILRRDAIATMVASAQSSGSDMVVAAAVRFDEEGRTRPSWADELHDRARVGIAAVDFPEIVRNNYTWNKLYRTSFWHGCNLWFREGVSYEDQPIITQLYVRASRIDVLPAVVYEWRKRSDGSSISQQTHSVQDLRDRIAAWDVSHEALAAEAPREVYDAWLKTLYTKHFHWYLNNRSTADREYWTVLRGAIVRLTEGVSASFLTDVPPQLRLAVELARRDLHAEFLEFRRKEGYQLDLFPARLTDQGLDFRLPTSESPHLGIPDWVYRLEDDHIPIGHRLDTAVWTEDGHLRVTGWAFFRFVDLYERESDVSVLLTHPRSGRRVEVASERDPDRTLVQAMDDMHADYDVASFVADLPVADFLAACGTADGDELGLEVSVRTGRLHRTVVVTRRHVGGSARYLRPRTIGPFVVRPVDQRVTGAPFLLHCAVPAIQVTDLRLGPGEISGRVVSGLDHGEHELVLGPADSPDTHRSAARVHDGGHFTVRLPEVVTSAQPKASGHPLRWGVRVRPRGHDEQPIAPAGLRPEQQHTWADGSVLSLRQSHTGALLLEKCTPFAVIHTATVSGEALRLSGHAPGAGDGTMSVVLESHKATSSAGTADLTDGNFEVTVPLSHRRWRFGELAVPSGMYTVRVSLHLPDGTTSVAPAQVSDPLGDRLPLPYDGTFAGVTFIRGRERELQCQLLPPAGRSARGRYRRSRLERISPSLRCPGPLRGVLMETNFGEVSGDSAARVHEELRRRGADLPIYWTVRDYSVPVPEGGIPVVRSSPEWFEVLRSARYFVENMHQPLFHRKPEGQTIVATFHGYPFKQMGYPHWRENLDLSQERIDRYTALAGEWDYLVSPAKYATPLLRQHFGYQGPVLEIGYPRNDVLLSAQAPQIRSQTRRSLGIAEGKTAVLYAPTFRDYMAVNDRRAPMVDFLDVERLSKGLGDGYVVLVRGHAFNRRVPKRLGRDTHIVDVTDYPDPADLVLASDVAVLDYSSIRFDFGVTGKPMVFLVPDVDRYENARGWLLDYPPTAPGPFLRSTDDVVSALKDLDSVVAHHAEAYSRFKREFLHLEDGRASARLVDAVFVPHGDAPPSDTG
jgi:CDP-glycerol glycerophosphotransferase